MTPERIAVDTSVAVPLLVAAHDHHANVAAWARGRSLHLSGQALPETYSVLTRLPGDARLAPADAALFIDANFGEALVLSARAFQAVHSELSRSGGAGGATYDGLVALAAREHNAVLATRDARARSTYERLGVTVEVIPDAGVSPLGGSP